MDSKLQELSNGTKNTQIGVRMTKLWSYEVGAKTGDCSNVATLQKRCCTTSRRCCTTSRRSGSVLGGFLAHNGGFLSSNPKETRRRRLGLGKGDFVHTLGPRRRLGAVFEDLGEDHEICGRKSETHHHLIIIVSSFSFLMFYPKFMIYQTSIML